MRIANYNNTIYNNNVGLKNDFQNRNVKYNTGNIEQDSFVKSATTSSSNNIQFGSASIKTILLIKPTYSCL